MTAPPMEILPLSLEGLGEVAVRRYGQGPLPLLALHGFGHTGRQFHGLATRLEDAVTLYAPDLPFHGDTIWHGAHCTPEDMAVLLGALMEQEGFTSMHLLGKSWGARFLLGMLPEQASIFRSLLLVSPDGIHTPWLNWLQHSRADLLRFFHHRRFRSALTVLARTLLGQDAYATRFLRQFVAHSDRFEATTLPCWRSLSHFTWRREEAATALQQAERPVMVALGEEDRIVHHTRIAQWAQGISGLRIATYPGGHQANWEALGPEIKDFLLRAEAAHALRQGH